MKKTLLIPCLCLIFSNLGFSQELFLKNSDRGSYLEHKVAAKENYYSIGRLYNIPPHDIETFNKLDMEKGLNIGQVLRIPLNASNFTQTGNKGTPVYLRLTGKQSLAKISSGNNKVSIENLRKWNGISGDQAEADTKLVVGFLVSKEMPSVTLDKTPPAKVTTEPKVVKTEPAEVKPKEEEKVVKTEPIIEKKLPVEQKSSASGQGYFKTSFDEQSRAAAPAKNEMVTSGIFKTASGWQDHKYYLLMDKVEPGTIVKIINPDKNKAVYAKVLGEMNGIRQNEGLNIRISNAAANALNVSETDKFIVKVNY